MKRTPTLWLIAVLVLAGGAVSTRAATLHQVIQLDVERDSLVLIAESIDPIGESALQLHVATMLLTPGQSSTLAISDGHLFVVAEAGAVALQSDRPIEGARLRSDGTEGASRWYWIDPQHDVTIPAGARIRFVGLPDAPALILLFSLVPVDANSSMPVDANSEPIGNDVSD